MLGHIETQKERALNDAGEREDMRAVKYETIITVICVNGHANEIKPEILDGVFYFKCSTCGTIYAQSSKACTKEREG